MLEAHADRYGRKLTAGFTLVEVLVALAIAAVLLTVVHELLTTTVHQQDLIRASEQSRIATGTLAGILHRDLEGLYAGGGEDEAAFALESSRAYPSHSVTLSFLTATPELRLSHEQQSAVRRVVYRLKPSTTRTGCLALRRAEQPYASAEDAFSEDVLLTDELIDFEVSVFDGASWVGEWPQEDVTKVPFGVRIRFSLAGCKRSAQWSILKTIDVVHYPKAGAPPARRSFHPPDTWGERR